MGFYTYGNKNVILADKIEKIPKGPHFVVLTDDTVSSYESGYGPNDRGSYSSTNITRMWICETKDVLQSLIEEIHAKGSKCVFYHVDGLGSIEIKVNVRIDV